MASTFSYGVKMFGSHPEGKVLKRFINQSVKRFLEVNHSVSQHSSTPHISRPIQANQLSLSECCHPNCVCVSQRRLTCVKFTCLQKVRCYTGQFQRSFVPNAVILWNMLDEVFPLPLAPSDGLILNQSEG